MDADDLIGDVLDGPVASDGIPADDPPTDCGPEVELTPARADDPAAKFDYTRESYSWAQDVFYVYDHLGATAKEVKTFSDARRALHKHAKSNMDSFMGQLVPKAMQLYEKAREKHGDGDNIIAEEKKGIVQLRQILVAAIEEAKHLT